MRRKGNEMWNSDRVLEWLRKRKDGLTSMVAMEELGIVQLPVVVLKLRRMGHCIRSVPLRGKNRYGQEVRYVKYVLEE